jgi:chemotaxis protein methyltransferase CheR
MRRGLGYVDASIEPNQAQYAIKQKTYQVGISTNVTRFFRESDHFHFLEKIVKEWFESGQRRLRIWSAACSTGEEPYSVAMTVLETNGSNNDVKILATDISTRALEAAYRGRYEATKMEQMSKIHAERYFDKALESDTRYYVAKPMLKRMVVFKRLNLATPPFPMRGPLDVVFCRNVMIYSDNRIRHKLLTEIHRLLKPEGYLLVGHSESLVGLSDGFRPIQPSIYIKTGILSI